jgi:hypothetical protein
MAMISWQLGLVEAENWVWCLHDRDPGNACPDTAVYLVIKRNFDPSFTAVDVLQPSSYVNGTLYSYQIYEICAGSPFLADAVEYPVDPVGRPYTSVAGGYLDFGGYYDSLTRDDVGGLRYLLRTNNLNVEGAGFDTFTHITNPVPQLLFTSNLHDFITVSLTNDPATLAALYPNLQIAGSWPFFTNVVTANTVYYYTNEPYAPAGIAVLRSRTELTTNVAIYYTHSFLNVYLAPGFPLVSNTSVPLLPGHSLSSAYYTVFQTNVSTTACGPYWPYGSICTNTTPTNAYVSGVYGDYFILPTNACDLELVSTQLIQAVLVTNATFVATNAPGTTNADQVSYSATPSYTFDQYVYVIHAVACATNYVDRYQGIERIQFVRTDESFVYDYTLDRYYSPITNEYTLTAMPLTNATPIQRRVRRVVATPDIVISAMDLTTEMGPHTTGRASRSLSITGFGLFASENFLVWTTNAPLSSLYGPGTIISGAEFIFNNVGPIYQVAYDPLTLYEDQQQLLLNWASFDGSTNPPVIYPDGTSILNYEQSVFVQVTPTYLPEAYVTATSIQTNYYSAPLQVTSYTASFTPPAFWSLAPDSPGLPTGLTLSTLNATNGLISGFPTNASGAVLPATYDFVVRVTDSQGRTLDRSYYIKLNP